MIEQRFIQIIAQEIGVTPEQVSAAVALLDRGAMIPFIAHYRGDLTGGLNELQLEAIEQRNQQFIAFTNRRDAARANIEAKGVLTEHLAYILDGCTDPLELEDLYLPFKKQRHTRGGMAAQRGLEPLADFIWAQVAQPGPIAFVAEEFIKDPERQGQVLSVEEAIEGARHILADRLAADFTARRFVRAWLQREGRLVVFATKYAGEQRKRFESFFGYNKLLAETEPGDLLAILRGLRIGVLRTEVFVDDEAAMKALSSHFTHDINSSFAPEIQAVVRDAYRRLLRIEIESQVLDEAKRHADESIAAAIREQVESALMTAPAGPVRVLAVMADRQGNMTMAVVDEAGACLDTVKIPAGAETAAALAASLPELMRRHKIHAVAVGNSGSGRQMGRQIYPMFRENRLPGAFLNYVPEAGLSAYALSPLGQQEFPDLDTQLCSTVSLGRRFQDPLAEMAKVDPRALAAGPQAHDVNQRRLQEMLYRTMEYCVNQVGVDLNTASVHLLRYICGLQLGTAQNIVAEREKRGRFNSRAELLEVSGIGERTHEQCAGFLRITGGAEALDATCIHPEAYSVVHGALEAAGKTVADMADNKAAADALNFEGSHPAWGVSTQYAWRAEMVAPAVDPRGCVKAPHRPKPAPEAITVQEGDVVEGKITNIADFGVFVNFGARKEGLVHLSELSGHFVRDAHEVVEIGQVVKAKVIKVDPASNRISLSLRALLPPEEFVREPRAPMDASRPQGPTEGRDDQRRGGDRARADRDGAPRGDRPARDDRGPRPERREGRREEGHPPREGRRSGPDRDRTPHSHTDTGGSLMNTLLADQLAALRNKLLSE